MRGAQGQPGAPFAWGRRAWTRHKMHSTPRGVWLNENLMKIRLWFPILVGLGGLAILLWLGTWQMQRLAWKQDVLARIDARIGAEPVPMPVTPDPVADRYLPVTLSGSFTDAPVQRMLASRRQTGAVYRHIAGFAQAEGGSVLVDIGWLPTGRDLPPLPTGAVTLTGNLDWPIESDGFTPEPDLSQNLWYARDVSDLAEVLGTEPVLVVLRTAPQPSLGATPWPVDTGSIPNDHAQYAITWFSLAVVWVLMTGLFIVRMRRRTSRVG